MIIRETDENGKVVRDVYLPDVEEISPTVEYEDYDTPHSYVRTNAPRASRVEYRIRVNNPNKVYAILLDHSLVSDSFGIVKTPLYKALRFHKIPGFKKTLPGTKRS